MKFDGSTYSPEHDEERLSSLLERVKALMSDETARTLAQIVAKTGGTEASVSARLRDLRKPRFGGFIVEKEPMGDRTKGLFVYSVKPPKCPIKDALFIEPNGQVAFL